MFGWTVARGTHVPSVGINYTPVPLITTGAEQRQGQSGKATPG
ncbi:inverse autotransporter beta domain-containing protein [Salmonella enterica subsp. enterica]|nr:inverse autotransporter beta domain-containing protein [Salmonella enterica subsp. enterica]